MGALSYLRSSRYKRTNKMIKIVLIVAAAILGALTAFDNETQEIDSCEVNTIEGCQQESGLLYSDDDVDMTSFQIPKDFDVNKVVEAITTGDGWFKLEGMHSEEDIVMARERVYHHNHADKFLSQSTKHETKDEAHNLFSGMVWALFNKGRIFEKMAQHPAILNISNIVLGERSAISSYAANTVLPGQGGQLPHLDYPYYRLFYPSKQPSHHGLRPSSISPVCHPSHRLQLREWRHCYQTQLSQEPQVPG